MGLNKFVALFTTSDCHSNNASNHKTHHNNLIIHQTHIDRPNGISSTTYNSELDIYGTTQRFRKSLLWSSLRKPKKLKGLQEHMLWWHTVRLIDQCGGSVRISVRACVIVLHELFIGNGYFQYAHQVDYKMVLQTSIFCEYSN